MSKKIKRQKRHHRTYCRITRRQRGMLDDLFAGTGSEEDIIEKKKISRYMYERWLADENFVAEFQRRLQRARRQGELFIARYSSVAAVKLIELIESKNAETARKACIDIITLMRPKASKTTPEAEEKDENSPAELPTEVASRLLAAISEKK
jgi:hypothetical protein